MIPSVIFEDSELKAQTVAQKAMAIVQQALSSGSVLFSLPKGLFGDRFNVTRSFKNKSLAKWNFAPLVCTINVRLMSCSLRQNSRVFLMLLLL
jgi:hypothetical protein